MTHPTGGTAREGLARQVGMVVDHRHANAAGGLVVASSKGVARKRFGAADRTATNAAAAAGGGVRIGAAGSLAASAPGTAGRA